MRLFVSASIHQGRESFGIESRGRQCAFMALNSILYEQISPVTAWSANTLDVILMNGDRMFLSALRSRLIPDTASLSLSDLPTRVRLVPEYRSIVTCRLDSDSYKSPFVATNKSPAEATNIEPIPDVVAIQKQTPDVVLPDEALPDKAQIFIKYGEFLQGHIVEGHELNHHHELWTRLTI